MDWHSGFEHFVRSNVPLRDFVWYRLGGPARWFCEPRDEAELAALLDRLRDASVPWRVLGRGANVLIRDAGFDGAVIRLAGREFERVAFEQALVHASAGADFPRLVRETIRRGLVGLEKLAGIPGSLGGVIRMNAGGRYGDIRDFVRAVRWIDRAGEIVEKPADAVGFAYRHTALDGCVVLGATLELCEGDAQVALAEHQRIWREKYDTQPPMAERTSGCVFKNPPGDAAGRLVDAAGLKNPKRVGGACISERHANFIVADQNATAADVLALIDLARQRVRETTGIELETEVEIW